MIEVLKQALEALEEVQEWMNTSDWFNDRVTSLRQAIAEAEHNYQGSDAAKAAHMMDLYEALGVRWGDNPFAVIAKMRSIAELESQEPVALPCCGYTDASAVKWNPLNGVVQCHNCGQNYTTSQRTWQGLTDEEKHKTWYEMQNIMGWYSFQEIANAIEAKLKEKNCAG